MDNQERDIGGVGRRLLTFAGLVMIVAIPAVLTATAQASTDDQGVPLSGMRVAPFGPCGDDAFAHTLSDGTTLCTHGPDPAPEGMDVASTANPPMMAASANTPCIGDGTSGKRVQLLYVRASDKPDNYAAFAAAADSYASGMNEIINGSAAQTGGERHIRFKMNPDCSLDTDHVVIAPADDDTFWATVNAVEAQGYSAATMKYVMFVEANIYCGLGTWWGDDDPSQSNLSNTTVGYGRVDKGCWSATVAAHELVHTLGGVQSSSPNASGLGHCTDESDLMCYADGAGLPIQMLCTGPGYEGRLDCNSDDYFDTDPEPGSYLATHWNVANSSWLSAEGESTDPPAKPTGVVVAPASSPTRCTTAGSCTVTVAWNQSAGANSYTVTSNAGQVAQSSSTSASFTAPAGSSIWVKVTAHNTHGSSPASATVNYTLVAPLKGWVAWSNGHVDTLGGSNHLGDAGGLGGSPVVAGAALPAGGGYWLVHSDGTVRAYGDAGHHGDMSGIPLQGAIAAMAATPAGEGYWLMGTDGGIFSFGDATFRGSMGGQPLNSPVRSITASADGNGYWLVGGDGGIFAFDVPFHGSLPGAGSDDEGVRIRADAGGASYMILTPGGEVYHFKNGKLLAVHVLEPQVFAKAVDLFLV